jgi:nucleoside-diphosphate-sugar epimerase
MSHVVPDLVQKVLKGQDPLRILGSGDQVRCYTYGGDLARGIAAAMFHPAAVNEEFNLSTPTPTTVRKLARVIWEKVHGTAPPAKLFRFESDPPYRHDVARRVPDTSKAKRVLGFEAKTGLSEMLDEVIPWIRQEIAEGRI